MTEETKKPVPPTRAERTVRVVFRFSLIAAFAVISSCVLLLECFHDEERRIEMNRDQDSDSARPLPITIIILYFSIVAAIATIIIWPVVLVLVRLFDQSAPRIGRSPVPLEIKMKEDAASGDDGLTNDSQDDAVE